jgi:hypothetical protein
MVGEGLSTVEQRLGPSVEWTDGRRAWTQGVGIVGLRLNVCSVKVDPMGKVVAAEFHEED